MVINKWYISFESQTSLHTTGKCHRPATFFVKKRKIFENVKSERAATNFQKSRTPGAQP